MSDLLIDDLKDQIASGQAIAIVGAGVSVGATKGAPVASWSGLLQHGIERCLAVGRPKPDKAWADRQQGALDTGDLEDWLGVAEQVSRRLGYPNGPEWGRWIRETVGALKAQDRTVLEALRDLGVSIATTNYDSLIKDTTGWPPVTWRDGVRVERVLRGDEDGILHLHGHWDAPESVVLGVRSYEEVLGDAHAQTVLHALSLMRTFVFVGFGAGLADPNFGSLFEWMRGVLSRSQYRHFRLMRNCESPTTLASQQIHDVCYGEAFEDLPIFLSKLRGPKKQVPKKSVTSRFLPPPPARCVGREDPLETVLTTLLSKEPARLPILGGPGVGKSTLCLHALHDARVSKRFKARRYFIRCEKAKSGDELIASIGSVLKLKDCDDSLGSILEFFRSKPAVLALDNLETPWETDPLATEDLLAELAGLPTLEMLVSLRGLQKPLRVNWGISVVVKPLNEKQCRELFLSITGLHLETDRNLGRLMAALDGLPLAVELLAYASEGQPNLDGVLKRLENERTNLFTRGYSQDRNANLDASFELSIWGQRMTDGSRRLLSCLSMMPEGLAQGKLGDLLLQEGYTAASILRQVGLAYDEGDRLLTLAPLRQFVASRYPVAPDDLARVRAMPKTNRVRRGVRS